MRGIFKGAALKFPFFLVPFSFGNERKRNSARRANTARLRAIAKEGYGKGGYFGFTQGSVSSKVAITARPLRGRTATFHRR